MGFVNWKLCSYVKWHKHMYSKKELQVTLIPAIETNNILKRVLRYIKQSKNLLLNCNLHELNAIYLSYTAINCSCKLIPNV